MNSMLPFYFILFLDVLSFVSQCFVWAFFKSSLPFAYLLWFPISCFLRVACVYVFLLFLFSACLFCYIIVCLLFYWPDHFLKGEGERNNGVEWIWKELIEGGNVIKIYYVNKVIFNKRKEKYLILCSSGRLAHSSLLLLLLLGPCQGNTDIVARMRKRFFLVCLTEYLRSSNVIL